MNNYIIRYLWGSSQKNWWYHIRISDGESYSALRITHSDVKKMPAEEVKRTISLIREIYKRNRHNKELRLEIIDTRTSKVVSLKELEFAPQMDLSGDISRFELIDFD